MKSPEVEIAKLEGMPPDQLRAEWRAVFRTVPPQVSADLLVRTLAWRVQERAHGGLSPAIIRELDRLNREICTKGNVLEASKYRLRPGTRLIREWQGRVHVIHVSEEGFSYDDRSYGSLSQVARDITGAHWSGPRFFGLKARRQIPDARQKRLKSVANG